MIQEQLTGKVQTVLGLIDPDSLGVTLPHEHLLVDASTWFVEPIEANEKILAHQPVSLENLYWVKANFLSSVDDLRLSDEETAVKEALLYKWAGGTTIIDVTCSDVLGRDPIALTRISRATGLNIIMGTGYYVEPTHPPVLAAKTEEQIADEIVHDILTDVADTGVRAGIIGEIGCGVPFSCAERKVLRACAIAQAHTGAALSIHPSHVDDVVLENIEVLDNAGADLSRTVVSHVDSWNLSRTTLRKILAKGCYIEYDTFGYPGLFPPVAGHYLDVPSDMRRANDIISLIAEGHLNQILLSHDICHKHLLTTYGGYGYAHILRNIVPMMQGKGISEEQIHTLLVDNPRRVLTIVKTRELR